MWTQKLVTRITSHRGRIAIVVMWLFAASSIGAQADRTDGLSTGIRVQTGLINVLHRRRTLDRGDRHRGRRAERRVDACGSNSSPTRRTGSFRQVKAC